ncbi:MAG: carbohydrate binding domain-containing protein [Planctomycetota bacterium]|jgi:hypothetical protein
MLSENLMRIFSIVLLFALAGTVSADDIVFDANSSNYVNGSWGLSWTHTIGGGQNRILIVGLAGEDNSDNDLVVSSIRYNSVNMHHVIGSSITEGEPTGYKMKTELYYLLDDELPSSGAHTISVNYSGEVSRICGGGISLANVSQQSAEAVDTNSIASGRNISTDITIGSSGMWLVDVVGGSEKEGVFSSTSGGMVEQFNIVSGGSSAAGSTKAASTGTTTMSWYHPSIGRMTHSVAAFAPVNISKAGNPYPPHMVSDVERNVELSWSAGDGADSHDIYLSTDFNDVNSADNSLPVGTSVYKGNQLIADTTYDPYSILKSEETYYWRIDEVDDAGPTITRGSIWSFTVEEYIAADFTGDGLVNNEDAEILAADWLKSEPEVLQADADLNGQVDFNDYGFLAGDWEPIPEGPIEMLISSIEDTAEMNKWSSNGTRSLSTEHVTDGTYSMYIENFSGSPQFSYSGSQLDISSYRKIKFDIFVENAPMTVKAQFRDIYSNLYTAWYYLYNEGFSVVEYSIAGMATLIDTSRFVSMSIITESGGSGSVVYVDNLRAMKGTDDDSWLANQDPGKPLIVVPGNVVENGDFELGYQGWGSWGQWDGGQYIFGSGSGDNVKSGIASASIICIVEGRGGIYREVSLEPGDYELRFWVKASGSGVTARYWFNGGVSSGGSCPDFTVPTNWTEKVYSVTSTSTSSPLLYFFHTGINTLYYDAVSLAKTGSGGGDPPDPNLWTPKIVTLDGQITLVDGEPFFPIGIYGGNPSALGGTGFNMTTTAVEGTTTEALDDCNDHGLMTWVNLSGVARAHLPGQAAIAARPFKRHPAVLCWYNCDEPDHSSWNVPPPEIRYMSTLLHEEDPNHPTSVLMMPWAPSNMYQYSDTADIQMTDSYSWTVSTVIDQTDTLRDSTGQNRPMWMVLRFAWDSEADPSSEYLYATTYGAITHTANGVLWFAYKPGSPSWSTLVDITLELEDLSPALVSDTSPLQVTVSDPDIHTILKEYDGDLYLIAINISSAVNNVDLTVSGVTATSAEVKFESRTEPIVSGTITDNFAASQRHVYVFSAP